MNLAQQLEEREQLESKIKLNEQKHRSLLLEQGQLRLKRREAENAYNGHSVKYERQKDNHSKRMTEESKSDLDDVCSQLEMIGKDIDLLSRNICDDKVKLEAIKINVTGLELVKQQEIVKSDQVKIQNIEALIGEQNRIIELASNKIATAEPLKKQRGLLLAEAATGKDNAKEISALAEKIAAAETHDRKKNDANATAATNAKETIEGLQEMLDGIKQTLSTKQKALDYMRDAMLTQLAIAEAEKFKVAAYQLAESIKAIGVMDGLIAKIGIKAYSGVCPANNLIKIPTLSNMEPSGYGGDFINIFTGASLPNEECERILAVLQLEGFEGIN